MFENELKSVEKIILERLRAKGIESLGSVSWAPIPFAGQWGFGAAIGFQAAAEEAKVTQGVNIPSRAKEIADSLAEEVEIPPGFERIEAARGYLNLYVKTEVYATRVIDLILKLGDDYGKGEPKSERVMVEYSQPNTHKTFHVGHLRNTILGGAIANIFESLGHETVRANYLGDIGWHVVKWLWCYLRFHENEEPTGDRLRWMQEIYSQATQLVEDNPEYEAEAREVFARWEDRDPSLVDLWKKTRQWSIDAFLEIYSVLGEEFDVLFFESEVEDSGKELIQDLIARGIATDERESGGTVAVKIDQLLGLEKESYRVLVVLRSDGTSLYATKDLPLAINKFEQWNIDRSIYVIDVRQSLYMKQIFKTLEIMGFKQAQNCYHLAYEIVNLPGDVTMSSREGTVVIFEDLLREAIKRASIITKQKNPNLTEAENEDVSRSVALGAIKYSLLAVDTNKIATFDWETALDFEGQASPYIQYAHVRANSILNRAGTLPTKGPEELELESQEISLLDRLSRLPDVIKRSAADYKPLHLANYAYDLAREFNDFYQRSPVLNAEDDIRDFRLRLTAASRQTLANALRIMGIAAPEIM
jgi:arginyl-tRNA synthetase